MRLAFCDDDDDDGYDDDDDDDETSSRRVWLYCGPVTRFRHSQNSPKLISQICLRSSALETSSRRVWLHCGPMTSVFDSSAGTVS